MCAAWAEEFEREYAAASAADRIDPGLARVGIALFGALPETADNRVLPCIDLHGGNILAAQRAPWLVIDPKPYLGDPAYDVLQHMLNCEDRLAAAGLAKRMAGLAGIDPRPGPAVAVRPQRAGVDWLAAHAPGGQAACARLARRRPELTCPGNWRSTSAAARPAVQGQADGLIRLSGRIPWLRHPINHHVAGATPKPRGPR